MNRVVVTGLGVVAPNGVNLAQFDNAMRQGISGISHIPILQHWNMGSHVAAYPSAFNPQVLQPYLSAGVLKNLRSTGLQYAVAAAAEAWLHAGLSISKTQYLPQAGCIFGSSIADINHILYGIQELEAARGLQIGMRQIEQLMASGSAAYISGMLGLGGRVSSNSSACCTGTESIILAYEQIKLGNATTMLAGSTEASSPHMWALFDAMRVCNRNHNHAPAQASRPMQTDSGGFVAGSGAAALVLENYDTAQQRGATIYAEITGTALNSGGQRNGGSITAPSITGVIACIQKAIKQAGITPQQIDLISGHLTGTFADALEVQNWATALSLSPHQFPYINTPKGLIGHCISAAGSIETVAAILQLHHGYIHANANCTALQPAIHNIVSECSIVTSTLTQPVKCIIKANFGFGDVNSCLVLQQPN